MASREQAKQERRDDIVNAARKLVRRSGSSGFSMRTLAREAGVSIATPYNLLGSKQAVMDAILTSELRSFENSVLEIDADPLEVFFAAIDLASDNLESHPAYFRAIFLADRGNGGRLFRSTLHGLWTHLVIQAKNAGNLLEDVDPQALANNLGNTFLSGVLQWAVDERSVDELASRIQYGVALSLKAMAAPDSAVTLQNKALDVQSRLGSTEVDTADGNGSAESKDVEPGTSERKPDRQPPAATSSRSASGEDIGSGAGTRHPSKRK